MRWLPLSVVMLGCGGFGHPGAGSATGGAGGGAGAGSGGTPALPAPPPTTLFQGATPTRPPTPMLPAVPPTSAPPLEPSPTSLADLPPIFAGVPQRAARAVPISGGTLLVTEDGTTAVAADSDRDQVYLVDLAARTVRTVALAAGDEPGRVVEGKNGRVYVAARRGGVVVAIDRAQAHVSARFAACNAPRGLAFDAASERLYVTCRSGRLLTLDAQSGAPAGVRELDEDLRDVFVQAGKLVLTRFRSAEVLVLDLAGERLQRARPARRGAFTPGVAFRALPHPSGTVILAHQLVTDAPIPSGAGAYYGGSCASSSGVVQQALTTVALDGVAFGASSDAAVDPSVRTNWFGSATVDGLPSMSVTVDGAAGPLDIAISRDGVRFAVVASGNSWTVRQELPNLLVGSLAERGRLPSSLGPCRGRPFEARHLPGELVAAAFDAAGRYVAQSREPAMLAIEGDVIIPLSADSRFDTGHATFHLNSGGGITCASCHPEGGEDGHVWAFSKEGLRRSQPLDGGVLARQPFHWQGDLASFDAFFAEVMIRRMALPVVPPAAAREALATWLDGVPAAAPLDAIDAQAVERGRALFFDARVGCGECHSGDSYADNRLHDVGSGGWFVTPPLRGVALRAPFMHDGCAATLRERFGLCGGTAHGDTSGLDDAALDDLVAFMKSL